MKYSSVKVAEEELFIYIRSFIKKTLSIGSVSRLYIVKMYRYVTDCVRKNMYNTFIYQSQ